MGLKEIIQAGGQLKRDIISFTETLGSGSVSLGSTYGILNIESSAPCRLRLYDNSQSLEDSVEKLRIFQDTNIPNNIALVGDFTMSSAGSYTIDPMIYGHTHDKVNTYYRIDKSVGSPVTITVTRFLLEDANLPATPGSSYSKDNRRSMAYITANLAGGEIVSGTLGDINTVPTTYLLISASKEDASQILRLRLYSTSSALYNTTEKVRPFSTEPNKSTRIIVDAVLSGSNVIYFSPKIVGANLEYLKNNLNELITDQAKIFGKNEIYYVLENANTGGSVPVSASIYVYSLED